MRHRVLLVDDSPEIQNIVTQFVKSPQIEIDCAETIKQANHCISRNHYDLYLLDINLPDGNGVTLCNKLQSEDANTPIFILTVEDDISQLAYSFSSGADDFITKPFDGVELKIRVESKLKKVEMTKSTQSVLDFGELVINQNSQEVSVEDQGDKRIIQLTALEYKILSYLAQRKNEVVDRDTLLNEIWGTNVHVYSRSVDTHISKLRKKLCCCGDTIESVHGVGYKFVPPPSINL